MGYIDWFKSVPFLKGIGNAKQASQTDENNEFWQALYSLIGIDRVHFYKQDPASYIEKGYTVNPHVYSIINKIIEPASMVPWGVFEVVDEAQLRRSKTYAQKGDFHMSEVYRLKALKPLEGVEGAMLNKFFTDPNECQSWQEWILEAMGFKLLLGNSFRYGINPIGFGSDENPFFTKAYNMPAQFVEIIAGTWQQPVSGYKLIMNQSITFEPNKVLHSKKWNPNYSANGGFTMSSHFNSLSLGDSGSNFYGLSPLSPLLKVVKRSNDSYVANMRMLENGIPAGILSNEGQRLGSDDLKKLKKEFNSKFGGAKNKNEILFASTAVKWQSLGMNSVDMQLLESNKIDKKEIAGVYNIPLALISDDASTFNNLDTSLRLLWENTIIPTLEGERQDLSRWLLPGWEEETGKKLEIAYDLSGVKAIQKDLNKLREHLRKEMELGIWNGNEFRAMINEAVDEKDPVLNQRVRATRLNVVNSETNGQED